MVGICACIRDAGLCVLPCAGVDPGQELICTNAGKAAGRRRPGRAFLQIFRLNHAPLDTGRPPAFWRRGSSCSGASARVADPELAYSSRWRHSEGGIPINGMAAPTLLVGVHPSRSDGGAAWGLTPAGRRYHAVFGMLHGPWPRSTAAGGLRAACSLCHKRTRLAERRSRSRFDRS